MNKIEVKICLGTTCFVLGNSELQDLQEELGEELSEYVEFIATSCLDLCKDAHYKRVPCATVDGVVLENVNRAGLIKYIENLVREKFKTEPENEK